MTRFAPSPTGPLHLGHAYAAWFAWKHAREGGRCLLRLEDIDPQRSRATFATAIEADLRWLGLAFDGVRRQSAHLAEYQAALETLRAHGLLYPCFCSRAAVLREAAASAAAPHGPDGAVLYPGTCRALPAAERAARLAAGTPHGWRLDMAAALARMPALTYHECGQGRIACAPERFGDVLLGRRDAPVSYHLCATHDDAAGGITLVTRGEDLRACTDVHRLLQALLGWQEPAYAHHPLLRDAAGQRLAKRDGAVALARLREAGVPAAEVWRRAGVLPSDAPPCR